jgi:hypothetical protein
MFAPIQLSNATLEQPALEDRESPAFLKAFIERAIDKPSSPQPFYKDSLAPEQSFFVGLHAFTGMDPPLRGESQGRAGGVFPVSFAFFFLERRNIQSATAPAPIALNAESHNNVSSSAHPRRAESIPNGYANKILRSSNSTYPRNI